MASKEFAVSDGPVRQDQGFLTSEDCSDHGQNSKLAYPFLGRHYPKERFSLRDSSFSYIGRLKHSKLLENTKDSEEQYGYSMHLSL